ncbi:low temperature requirement protein A [Hymenobacter sp. GOD-10R]|uniref:low temperature requirement protein A n=1 Tax=Hymenobacter sp. GOD-10R TaxID=3093922 RepID=UPI002D792412|nr:low temperature requirement protein A [Hymenobacter sp. GOD-10R]WRQ30651.1 low temperature requirement protein A [Hymenobacter sp. GOD-10R]
MSHYPPDTVPRLRASDPPGTRRPSWLELLTDLAFVVILGQLVRRLLEVPGEVAVGDLLLLVVPVWWLWNGLTFYTNRFAVVNDLGDFLFTVVQLLGLLVLAVVTKLALTSHANTVLFVCIYAGLRGVVHLQYARVAYFVPVARPYVRHVQVGFGVSLACWVGAALAPTPLSYCLWALALAAEIGTPLVAGGRALHQHIPPDARHLPGRVATFVLLVLGQVAHGVTQGLSQTGLSGEGLGRAVLAGLTLIGLGGAYFTRVYEAPVQALSERQRTGPFWAWVYLHLPLTLCLLVSSAGLTLAVADKRALALTSLLVGAGVGGSYLVMGLLGLVNQWASEQPQPGTKLRVTIRVAAGSCLVLAAPWVSPLLLLLLGTATGLGIVLVDYFGPAAPVTGFTTIASRYTHDPTKKPGPLKDVPPNLAPTEPAAPNQRVLGLASKEEAC